jgi:hypothetical protein
MHTPKFVLCLLTLFACALKPAVGCLPSKPHPISKQETARKVRILFIGNSAIYFHNLPAIVSGIAASGPDPIQVESELIAEGGQTLEGHWLEGRAQKEIHARHWDYVVLQEQSCLNDEIEINGFPSISGWESYHQFAKMFDAEAKSVGAKTVILSLWSHKGTAPREQQALDYASHSLAQEIGATLVPAGSVWRAMEKRDRNLELYYDDFHPTRPASYMFAVAFYAAVFHKNPAGLATKAIGTDIALNNQPGATSDAVLVDVPKTQADEIKQVAYDVVRHVPHQASKPADLVIPSLPQGQAIRKEEVVGTWTGTATVFTETPLPLNFEISVIDGALVANTHFGLKHPVDEKAIKGGIEGKVLWFENPNGVNDSFIRYRAVLIENHLTGVAEVWQARHLTYIGTLSVQRRL